MYILIGACVVGSMRPLDSYMQWDKDPSTMLCGSHRSEVFAYHTVSHLEKDALGAIHFHHKIIFNFAFL